MSNEEALGEIRLQKQFAVRERMAQLERLYRIGMSILAANASLCGNKIWPHHGMMVESLSSVPEHYKDAMQIFYGVQNQLTVAYITPHSPADGKILTGDQILKIDGISIPSGSKGRKVFFETLAKGDPARAITLTVERGRNKKRHDITLNTAPGCASNLVFEEEDEVNAYADGINITFTAGMMRFAADDNMMAGVLGHELAHNARLHIEAKSLNALMGQIAGLIIVAGTGIDMSDLLSDMGMDAFSQDFETEADYVGLYMLARAGYDMDKAVDLQRRFAASYPEAIHLTGSTHPSTAKRFISMKKTVAEIREKQAKGLALLPQEKPSGLNGL